MFTSIQKTLKLTLVFIMGAALFAACDNGDGTGPSPEMNIIETVQANSNLSSLEERLSDSELADTLSQDGPLTLFGPSNEATLPEDVDSDMIKYHIVDMNLTYKDLQDRSSVETLSGDSLYFSTDDGEVSINDGQAMISAEGLEATNGMIFVVDSVLSVPEQ